MSMLLPSIANLVEFYNLFAAPVKVLTALQIRYIIFLDNKISGVLDFSG